MQEVQTVLGPIMPEELGFTLMHEHLICGQPGRSALVAGDEREKLVEFCADSLEEARSYGMETFVDATPIDLGRDVDLLRRVAERTGVNVIAATGFYMETPDSPYREDLRSPEAVFEILMREITLGIEGTAIRAGVIKVGTGSGSISTYESNILMAAARAQKETGVPIITHTEDGTMGPEQADLLLSKGADPSHIAIGHMVGSSDLRYHLAVLDRGVFVAFDRLGLEAVCPGRLAKGCIIGLLGIGFENQVILSHDYVRHFPGNPVSRSGALREVMPNWSYIHIMVDIIPYLKHAGVTDEKIRTMMIDNPKVLFGG